MDKHLCCPRCGVELIEHCRTKTSNPAQCGWIRCPNNTCPADTYDLARGVLMLRDHSVEQLGA